ncbi:MAG: 16S rRNA (adenine(1518)-N(6)/adenine(1519)-N(6))-dimethyltransferase RsmA [Pseudomonadota bacterium]
MSSWIEHLREKQIRPSRKLGQNFLIHSSTAQKIVRWAGVENGDCVLEIGPGLGAMTEELLRAGCKVWAVEKDARLVEILKERFANELGLVVIHADVLEYDVSKIITSPSSSGIRVVSNLPYSISTPILEKLLDHLPLFRDFCLLFQSELVDRLGGTVGTKDYGRLSIWVQALCEVEKGPTISAGSFFPAPDVESRLVRLTPLKTPLVPVEEQEALRQITAKIFQHRRKSLRNSLLDSQFSKEQVAKALTEARIDPASRAETLSLEQLRKLTSALSGPM